MKQYWFMFLFLAGCSAPAPVAPTVEQSLDVVGGYELFVKAQEELRRSGIESVKWGLTPYLATETLLENYRPILAYVEARLGVPVELMVGDNYADLERRLVEGEVDAAIISPYSYVRAKVEEPGIEVFASQVAQGSVNYGAYIITREGSGIENVKQLKGRSFAYVDRRSTSGWLFPAARMLQEGVHPSEDVDAHFLGSHTEVFEAVLAGDYDAGATYEGALGEGRAVNPDAAVLLRVIAKAKRIPHEAYTVRAGFPAIGAEAMGQALSEISTATVEGRRLLLPLMRLNGFMPVDDSHYDVIREVESEVRKAGLEFAP